jgi:hypothetical protein
LRGWPIKSAKRWISAHERFCVKRPHIGETVTRAGPNTKTARLCLPFHCVRRERGNDRRGARDGR